ncbi:MAG: catalase [Dermatophilaceae bacterium]
MVDNNSERTPDPSDPGTAKPDLGAPAMVTATGSPIAAPPDARAQSGGTLTTSTGARLRDTDHSLKAGPRGPTLLQDHHLREKITHFDHERIPERVVHARGAAAHGVFSSYGSAVPVSCAQFLAAGVQTPVFVRFSTVLGSRGSADTVRDTRGFATKFYTAEGTFDLVGNNMPVFFIQDGIKFPDIIHAAKPQPDREIPQAQSAHDTFWDFVSLHTEAQHHTLWNMSDRGIPRSFRMMEGFGVHTFRLTNAEGRTTLVKFHWKPRLGVHSLVWEEAQLLGGVDPDYHRRDLYEAIESGAYPEWELGMQTFPDTPEQTFEGIDLLDPTKLVPEELAPVQRVGLLTLNRSPSNFFAEVEQVAFHVGNLVPGIDVTDDPLLQTRLFSYVDTQLTRLGGPNFNQIPINRPHAPVDDMLRDGMHQHAVHTGVAPYRPNSLDGGCPLVAGSGEGHALLDVPVPLPAASKVRRSPVSFEDHFSQARMFWLSMAPIEQGHIVAAYAFELGKCHHEAVKQRQLGALARIDPALCARVAGGLGLAPAGADRDLPAVAPSPALSQLGGTWPVDARSVGIVVDATSDLGEVLAARAELTRAGVTALVIAPTGGTLHHDDRQLTVERTYLTVRSAELDALVVAATAPASAGGLDPQVGLLLTEAFRHGKALLALPGAQAALESAGVPVTAPGVVLAQGPADVTTLLELLGRHRVWDRLVDPHAVGSVSAGEGPTP